MKDPVARVSVNLSRFYIFGSLLEIAFSALVDNRFPIVRKTRDRLVLWGMFMAVMALNILFVPAPVQKYVVIAAALYYAYEVYAILRRYYRVYFKMKRDMDNYYSENVSNFTRWMLLSAWATVIAQFASCAFAFCFLIGKKVPIKIIRLKKEMFSKNITARIISLGLSPFLILATDSVIKIGRAHV